MKIKEIASGRKDIFKIDPRLITEEPGFNVRLTYDGIEELADSIQNEGLKVPLQIYNKGDFLHVKDGHRRLRAINVALSRGVDIQSVPCIYMSGESEEQRTFDLITCNSGTPLTKLEHGIVFLRLQNFGYNQTDIAKRIAKSPAYVNQCVALANTPKKVQDLLSSGVVNDSTVLATIGTVDESKLYDILVESVNEVKNNGDGTARDISRVVRNKIGKETVSTRMKALNQWIEENAILEKDSPRYGMLCSVQSFLKGELSLDDLVKK